MRERVLIVGGTGLTGAHAALFLREAGYDVTLCSRNTPDLPCLAGFGHIAGSYVDDSIPPHSLEGFDALVFAAGADLRQLPPGEEEGAYFTRVNSVAIPRFISRAREAGVGRVVYIGSYYPQVAPEAIEHSIYVRSRHEADEAARALTSPSFSVCSLNAPFIIGYVPGVKVPHLKALVEYASGKRAGIPLVAPAGGVNHIASRSVAEAIHGALQRGQPGRAYLIGDENLSWKAYLERFFAAAGNPVDLPVSEEEHPLFPDVMLYAGRNAVIAYEPDNGELGYSRGHVSAAVAELVAAFR